MLVLAVASAAVWVMSVPGGPAPAAVAATVADCRGPVDGGCVEVRVTPTGGFATGAAPTLRELQMNVCHSGFATCFQPDDRSTREAALMITRYQPSVVTLNEICAEDILADSAPIPAAMFAIARDHADASMFAVFAPAVNRDTGLPYRCADGDLYGIGIVGRGTVGLATHHVYRDQFAGTNEERVAVCAPIDGAGLCTTHLESDDGVVAAGQCRELMAPAGIVDDVGYPTARPPTVVAGDFNLRDLAGCAPPGWHVTGDGIVQHVLTYGLRIVATRVAPTRYTDHPALVVDLAR